MREVLDKYNTEDNDNLRVRARQHIKKFSDEEFAKKIITVFKAIL
jgi:hypothetical protein